jgi:hypothetical protein
VIHEGPRDPAEPWFGAAQDRVPDSPLGRAELPGLRRALTTLSFPAPRAAVIDAASGSLDTNQVAWLAATLRDRTYGSYDEVVGALGRWGLDPPGPTSSL